MHTAGSFPIPALSIFFLLSRPPPRSTLFPYTTLFRSTIHPRGALRIGAQPPAHLHGLRSEEHTSELQSRGHLVCRLLLEKKNYCIYGMGELVDDSAFKILSIEV